MSDFRAIGGVSATLQSLLLDRMELPDGVSVPVTVGPPPFTLKDNDMHQDDPRVNLFLYRVTKNAFLENQEIPGLGSGNGYGHPPLSLNLHYLVTAYGNKQDSAGTTLLDETTAQYLLGSAMRVLHDICVLTDQLTTTRPPSGQTILHPSLRNAYEHLRLTLEPLSLEDVAKVWTALALRLRLSAAYVVNVVQIESRRPSTFPQPVGKPVSSTTPPLPSDPPSPGPWVYTFPIQTPTLTSVSVRRAGETAEEPFPYARIGDTLVLRGTSLTGPVNEAGFGDLVVPATVVGADVVEVLVPDATLAGGAAIRDELLVQPGVRTVRVVHRDPQIPHSRASSNEAALMVVPGVNQVGYAAGPNRTLAIAGSRLVSPTAGGETLIGRAAVSRNDYLSESPTSIVVPVPTTLPEGGVHVLVGDPLPDPVPIGSGPHSLALTIGGVTRSATPVADLTDPLPRASVAATVARLVHDSVPATGQPPDPRFTHARVALWGDRLVIVPGDLTSTITVPAGQPLAAALKLTGSAAAGTDDASISGLLTTPPQLSSPRPRLAVTIGAQTRTIDIPRGLSRLEDLASALETALHTAGGGQGFTQAALGAVVGQLLLVPGAADPVSFSAVPEDDTTVRELQWHADFAVRVRCNGAESIDAASVELPQ